MRRRKKLYAFIAVLLVMMLSFVSIDTSAAGLLYSSKIDGTKKVQLEKNRSGSMVKSEGSGEGGSGTGEGGSGAEEGGSDTGSGSASESGAGSGTDSGSSSNSESGKSVAENKQGSPEGEEETNAGVASGSGTGSGSGTASGSGTGSGSGSSNSSSGGTHSQQEKGVPEGETGNAPTDDAVGPIPAAPKNNSSGSSSEKKSSTGNSNNSKNNKENSGSGLSNEPEDEEPSMKGSLKSSSIGKDQFRIEQVRVVMPYIRAYFYPESDFDSSSSIKGQLGETEVELQDYKKWSETGYGIDYYFLIDNSKSVSKDDFSSVKEELADMSSYMKSADTISIYLVGDTSERLCEKLSSSDSAKLSEILDGIERDGDNTNLYNAIKEAADTIAAEDTDKVFSDTDDIDEGLNFGKNRSVIVAVTDGVNDTVNGYGKDETIQKLNENNVPFYLIQQRMQNEKGGESRSDIQQVVRQSGGDYVLCEELDEGGAVAELSKRLNSCYVATFKADTNKTSNDVVGFNIVYVTDAGEKSFTAKEVKRDKHVADENAPSVESVEITDEHSIKIVFTKDVSDEAKNLSLYAVTDDRGNSIKPTGADFDVNGTNTVILTTADKLWNGTYEISIGAGITDTSEEENEMGATTKSVVFSGGEDFVEVKESFFQKYWWLVLIIFILVVIAILVIVYLIIKKRKGLVVVDDKMVLADKVDEKVHLQIDRVQGQPVRPLGIPFTLVVKSGGKTIKEINTHIDSTIIVGRGDICDVIIDDLQMSRQHFAISEKNGVFKIMDLDSRNGTYLNGVKLAGERKLEKNDRIKAGSLDIVVRW